MSTTKTNLDTKMLDRKGEPMRDRDPRTGEAVGEAFTVRDILLMAIDTPQAGDDLIEVNTKIRIYALSRKIAAGKDIELSADDTTLLLERVRKGFSIPVYGQCVEVLDPAKLKNA